LSRGALLSLTVPALVVSLYFATDQDSVSDTFETSSDSEVALALAVLVLLVVVTFALGSALIGPSGQYLISLVLLAATRRLPWRLTRFLEDMHARGILRRPGMGYEFRHARVRDALLSGQPAGDRGPDATVLDR
jgi:hypothetical protein